MNTLPPREFCRQVGARPPKVPPSLVAAPPIANDARICRNLRNGSLKSRFTSRLSGEQVSTRRRIYVFGTTSVLLTKGSTLKRILVLGVTVFALVLAATASAALVPGVYDPDATGCPTATYSAGVLHLVKNCPTATNAAAGADITGFDGQTFTSASFTLASAASVRAARRGSTWSRRPGRSSSAATT